MSVLSMVADPQFQALGPSDQQAALSGLDADFGKLSSGDFKAAVTGLQKRAMARPDLIAPPKMSVGSPAAQPAQQQVDVTGAPVQSGAPGLSRGADYGIDSNGPVTDAVAGVASLCYAHDWNSYKETTMTDLLLVIIILILLCKR